jgi:hypothetical protein
MLHLPRRARCRSCTAVRIWFVNFDLDVLTKRLGRVSPSAGDQTAQFTVLSTAPDPRLA